MDHILRKEAERRLVRCVNVRRPPLEAPESDHNLVYAKVRIARRSAPNRRKRNSTKETSKMADLRRLMADPNLLCQVENAVAVTLPPIPDGPCISDVTADMADVMPSIAVELVPPDELEREARPQLGVRKRRGGMLLRDVQLIPEQCVRWFHILLNTKSPKLDPNIAEELDQGPENMPLGVQPTMQELTEAIRSLANGKVVGPDGVSVVLFKSTLNGDPALQRRLLDIVACIWRGKGLPQQWKYAIIMLLHKKKDRISCCQL